MWKTNIVCMCSAHSTGAAWALFGLCCACYDHTMILIEVLTINCYRVPGLLF